MSGPQTGKENPETTESLTPGSGILDSRQEGGEATDELYINNPDHPLRRGKPKHQNVAGRER